MNSTERFNEVRGWPENEKLTFLADDENTCIQLRVNLDHGLIPVRLLSEESPAMLQAVCSIPVKVPKVKISSIGLVLYRLEARLRVGSFQPDAEDGLVMFRLAQSIHAGPLTNSPSRPSVTASEIIVPFLQRMQSGTSAGENENRINQLNPPFRPGLCA